jgi:hypothetical protein
MRGMSCQDGLKPLEDLCESLRDAIWISCHEI